LSKRNKKIQVAFAGMLMAPGVAMAQQPPAPAPDPATPTPPTENKPGDPTGAPATMQPVTVTATRPSEDFLVTKGSINRLGAANLMDVPQTVVVINKALMQSQAVTSLEGALRNVPGVTIGAAEGGTIGNNININGFSARTDIYLDGMRDRGQYYRDVFALEQVEVLMGPSSMLFGRGSTGGVINQVMKKPGPKEATELSVMGTTNGLVRTTADVNIPFQETNAARVSAYFQAGKASTVDLTNVLDFGVAPSVTFGLGQPTTVTLTALLQHKKDQIFYGVPPLNGYPLNVPRNTAYGNSNDYTEQDVINLQSTVGHVFNEGLSLRNQTAFTYVNTVSRQASGQAVGTLSPAGVFTLAANGPGNTPYSGQPLSNLYVRQQSRDRNITDVTYENQLEVTGKLDTGFINHSMLAGIDVAYETYANATSTRTGNCNNTIITGSPGFVGCVPAGVTVANFSQPAPSVYGNFASAQAFSSGFYFNDTITVLPQLKLVAGLRYDIYNSQIWNSLNFTNQTGNTTPASINQVDTFTSVRGGAIFEPTKEQSYYFSYSTSFNPSLEQLVSTTGFQTLPPESNQGMEVGGKYDLLNGNLSVNGALFQITKYNARTTNIDGTFSPQGNVRVQGARVGVAGRITPEWQVFGGYAYLNGRIIEGIGTGTTGMVPLNTPKDSGSIWTTYTIKETYQIGGGAFYTGQRYANNTNTVTVPEYTRFDLTAAYIQPKYDIRLNVYNVFNVMFYDALAASDGGRAVPGSGTTGMLTLNYRL
jgi:catecholate siderophore receptor